jgi:Sugar (and other) transporter
MATGYGIGSIPCCAGHCVSINNPRIGNVSVFLSLYVKLMLADKVYWILDVKNDTNQAMLTKDYWPDRSSHDSESNDADSIRKEVPTEMTEFAIHTKEKMHPTAPEQSYQQNGSQGQDLIQIDFQTLGPPALALGSGETTQISHADAPGKKVINAFEDPHPREQSFGDFYKFFWTERNWTDLFGTAVNWMLLDFSFYLLGVNSSRIVPTMFGTPIPQGPYSKLITNGWHTMVATSIGAVLGYSRRNIQMWGFFILAGLFVLIGILYVLLLQTGSRPVIIVIYVSCQLFFNIGKFWLPSCDSKMT